MISSTKGSKNTTLAVRQKGEIIVYPETIFKFMIFQKSRGFFDYSCFIFCTFVFLCFFTEVEIVLL